MSRYDIGQLKDMLTDRLDQMVGDNLAAARKVGRNWYAGDLSGSEGKSLVIWHNGAFKDYSEGIQGDVLQLYAALYQGAPVVNGPVIEKAAQFVGLSAEAKPETDTERAARAKLRAANRAKSEKSEAERAEKKRRWWFKKWLDAERCTANDPVWSYLKGERGLDPAHFMTGKDLPGAIRFAPEWPFWAETQKTPTHHFPAMVTQMIGLLEPSIHGKKKYGCRAIHVTYLEQVNGEWRAKRDPKDGRTLRRVFAKSGGALLPLWKGGNSVSFTRADRDATLIICEGIEDGLTLALACPEFYVAAAYSITNLMKLQSPNPDGFGEIVLAADNDWNNPDCLKQIERMRHRITLSGRTCRVVFSQEGKDFNDQLRMADHAA